MDHAPSGLKAGGGITMTTISTISQGLAEVTPVVMHGQLVKLKLRTVQSGEGGTKWGVASRTQALQLTEKKWPGYEAGGGVLQSV